MSIHTISSRSAKLHITFKVDDVPAHLIKQTVGLRWAGMWVKEAWEGARRATDLAD